MEKASLEAEAKTQSDGLAAMSSETGGRRMVIAALLLAMMVTAVEQLVVSPAMTTIITQLKGFEIFPWVVSAYLLAATVSTPIYGKLADLFGRKPVLLFGLTLFSVGSVLSGTSMSMPQLIGMRAIQGLGAGAVGPVVLTMLGDMFTLKERAQVQAVFSSVWGLSSIGGPLVGGYLTDFLGWRFVFFLCVPFAVTAILLLIYYVSEPAVERTVAPIDWAGAALLTTGLSALLWVVLDGSRRGWIVNASLLATSAILIILFVIREHHAADPILPLDLMTRPVIGTSLFGSLFFGGILFGLETYVPLYVQGVRGGNATSSGLALMPLFISWAISAALAARALVHHGFRRAGLIGSGLVVMGLLMLVTGASFPSWSRPLFGVGLAIVGTGMGPTSISFILAIQHAVTWGQRGVATGAATFSRTIGGAVGVGLLGAALAWELGLRFAVAGAGGIDVAAALRPETHRDLRVDQLSLVRTNLALTLRDVYILITLFAVVSLVCAFWLPGRRATLAGTQADEPEEFDDDGLAIAAAEL
jgi:MFS family permease